MNCSQSLSTQTLTRLVRIQSPASVSDRFRTQNGFDYHILIIKKNSRESTKLRNLYEETSPDFRNCEWKIVDQIEGIQQGDFLRILK